MPRQEGLSGSGRNRHHESHQGCEAIPNLLNGFAKLDDSPVGRIARGDVVEAGSSKSTPVLISLALNVRVPKSIRSQRSARTSSRCTLVQSPNQRAFRIEVIRFAPSSCCVEKSGSAACHRNSRSLKARKRHQHLDTRALSDHPGANSQSRSTFSQTIDSGEERQVSTVTHMEAATDAGRRLWDIVRVEVIRFRSGRCTQWSHDTSRR